MCISTPPPCKVCGRARWFTFSLNRSSKYPTVNKSMGSEDEALQREVRQILTAPDQESGNPFNPQCQHLIPAQHLAPHPKQRHRESPELLGSQKLRVKGRCDLL